MAINKALLKYGYSQFKLDILEYCDTKDIVKREQYYIDYFNPEYNILKVAYSSLGYKHSEKALIKVKENLACLNKDKLIKVEIINLKTNSSKVYSSLTEASKELNISRTTLTKYIKNSMIFNKRAPRKLNSSQKNFNFRGYKFNANISVSNYDSNYLNHPNAIKIEVTDLKLNTITNYDSIHAVSRSLSIGSNTLSNYLKRNQKSPYLGRFLFKRVEGGGGQGTWMEVVMGMVYI